MFKVKNPDSDKFLVKLYGSLALTGKGHLTDYIIKETLYPIETQIEFDTKEECEIHPNTLDMIAYKNGEVIDKVRVYSVGGGTIKVEGTLENEIPEIYKLTKFEDIKLYCLEKNISLCQYVYETEEKEEITNYLRDVWKAMQTAIKNGLKASGLIPGKLKLKRKAKEIYEQKLENENSDIRKNRLLSSFAYAVSEENASGGIIVTSPTCRSIWCFTSSIVLYEN